MGALGGCPCSLFGTCLTPVPLELPQTLTEHTFSCNYSQILAETAQPPELSALEKQVLLPVSIAAAGGAEQLRLIVTKSPQEYAQNPAESALENLHFH